jgi:uncharacterized membrane protein YphA (DoxX/SURF4 family)
MPVTLMGFQISFNVIQDGGTLQTMLVLAGQIFSVLLIATGAAKLARPIDTRRAIKAIGLPFPGAVTYGVAVTEVLVGSLALITGAGPVLAGQAVLYTAFLLWVIVALRSDVPIASCGCLGRDDTPPYWGHVLVDLVAVVASSAGALTAAHRPIFDLPGTIAAFLVVLVGALMAWFILGDGARSSPRRAH